MQDSILVDTDVLIDFLRGYNKAVAFIENFSSRIILSSIDMEKARLKTLNVKLYPMIKGLQPAYKK